jgi:hypothetical protein
MGMVALDSATGSPVDVACEVEITESVTYFFLIIFVVLQLMILNYINSHKVC